MNYFIRKVILVIAGVGVFAFHSRAQSPLFIPPTLSGTSFNLNVQSGTTQFFPGQNTPTYGVNGNLLAPTLFLNKWDTVTMNVTNNIGGAITTTMHWHGLHVPPEDDGGPHQIIMPSTTWSPQFAVLNDAGTYWYHPHGANQTEMQVAKGIAGMIIIRDSAEANLTLPRTYGVDDFPLIVQTKCFDILYQVVIATVYDTVPMVNGTINAQLDVPAQVVRFRLLDGASDRSFNFGFSNNMNFHQIATDGGLLPQPVQMNRLLLSNGERAEILVDFSSMQGQQVFLMNYGSGMPNGVMGSPQVGMGMSQIPDYNLNPLNGADFNLLQINVVAPTSNPVTTIPSSLVPLNPWQQSQANANRHFLLAPEQMGPLYMVEGPFTINGEAFHMDSINVTTYLNNIETWTLENQTLVAHPFHIHDVQFFILDINGGPVPPHLQGRKDVALVMPNQTLTFITKFEDFSNDTVPYMYHCHLLHHEDDGMMGAFVVIDTSAVGIEEKYFSDGVLIFPNPSKDIFTVKGAGSPIEYVELYNTYGEKILRQQNSFTFNISALTPGIYFIKIKSKEKIINKKIVKQ